MMAASRSFSSQSPSRIFDEAYTVLENPSLPLNVSSDELPVNRALWKTDRTCIICSVRFKLLLHRYHCEFCYRGVCKQCSSYAFLHPETLVHKRCCTSCFSRFATTTIREELAKKIAVSHERMTIFEDELRNSEERKRQTEAKLRDLEYEVRRGRLKMTQVDREFEKEIETRKETLGLARRAKAQIGEKKAKTIEKIQQLRSQSEHKRREKQEHEELLSRCRADTQVLKSKLSQLQEETNLILHDHVKRAQTPPAERKLQIESEEEKGEALVILQVLEDKEAPKEGPQGETVPEEPDNTRTETHLEQLLSDLVSENVSLRRTLSDAPRRPILSERSRHPLTRRAVLAQPNRSCCSLF